MPSSPRNFDSDTIHHIYNRGTQKMTIFHHASDYQRFIAKLIELKERYNVQLLAWALMPNHFHFVLKPVTEGGETRGGKTFKVFKDLKGQEGCQGGISSFMQQLQNSYAKYYALKYTFSGKLFQGTFKSKHINGNSYFLQLLHYIHNQPKHHEITADNFDWPYTSLHDYWYQQKTGLQITDRNDSLLDISEYPSLFQGYVQQNEEEFDPAGL